ncbi:MAG: hypothetical protein HUN05_11375 [Desulfobacter sp.]|nr:MAG: hypothetical protein HUN05_11375 [Desulfobacter sp.]
MPLPSFFDVKLALEFCIEAHCFGEIYAKTIQGETAHSVQFNITSMDEQDRALLVKWINQASA